MKPPNTVGNGENYLSLTPDRAVSAGQTRPDHRQDAAQRGLKCQI
jgi:hypothetical protein